MKMGVSTVPRETSYIRTETASSITKLNDNSDCNDEKVSSITMVNDNNNCKDVNSKQLNAN